MNASLPLPRLLGTTVALKAIMAVTGLLLVGFLVGHMVGNLQVFDLFGGKQAINAYAAWLHSKPMLLWGTRFGRIGLISLHVVAAVTLVKRNAAARPTQYKLKKPIKSTYASRTMVMSGPILSAYIIYHLLHFTITGVGIPDFGGKDALGQVDVHRHIIVSFQSVPVSLAYLVAMSLLALHLWHGLWAFFQSLGLSSPRWDGARRHVATALTAVIIIGFMSVPLGVLLGIVR